MSSRDAVLDRLRMLLAILVVVCHIHYFEEIFEVESPPNNWKHLPLLLGHQSVIIFFVLSGYFVGGQAFLRYSNRTFLFFQFLVERLTRLWIVLVPALLLTFFSNQVTCLSNQNSMYCTERIEVGALSLSMNEVSNLKVFLGNVIFLQGIKAPVYGSNLPLWSIAYEFWYYMSIPFFIFFWKLRFRILKAGVLALAFSLIFFVGIPFNLFVWYLCWFVGALAFYVRKRFGTLRVKLSNRFFIPGAVLIMLVSRFLSGPLDEFSISVASDLCLAVIFSVILWLRSDHNSTYRFRLLEFSFSIYAFHFPLSILLYFAFWEKFSSKYGYFSVYRELFPYIAFILIITGCWALYFLTERHYLTLRRRIFDFFSFLKKSKWR